MSSSKKKQNCIEPAHGCDHDLVLGIDEAGRGPILGPMFLACVGLTKKATQSLLDVGVVDSKKFGSGVFAHRKRMALVPLILSQASHVAIEEVSVSEIDARTFLGQLNQLEQEKATQLILSAPPSDVIIADGARLFGPLQSQFPHLQAINKAEHAHVAVAAASVLAKTRRDEWWQSMVLQHCKEFGDWIGAGGGYPNPSTKRFLRAYCQKYGQIPKEGRRSWPWDFVEECLEENERKSLFFQ